MISNQLSGNSQGNQINKAKKYLKANPNDTIVSVTERFEFLYTTLYNSISKGKKPSVQP